MASLLDTNRFLQDPEERRRLLERNAYDSSVFEGARGLTRPAAQAPPAYRPSASAKKPSKIFEAL